MSREILFKAKRKNWRELSKEEWWVEGFYSQLPKPSLGATIIADGDLCAEDVSDYIIVNKCKQHSNFSNSFPFPVIENECFEIAPETLCQYTGLTDKNGKRIWENDILHNGNKMIVKWNEPCGRWDLYIVNVSHIPMGAWRPLVIDWRTFDWKEYSDCHECEVIGNIFDNPELLGGAE